MWVTGLGIISDADDSNVFFDHVFQQSTLHNPIPLDDDQHLKFSKAALARLPATIPLFSNLVFDRLDRFAKYAVLAAYEAMTQAKLADRDVQPSRIGVIIGTANGGLESLFVEHEKHVKYGRRPHPLTIPRVMGNGAASAISTLIGARGPVFGVTSACASAAQAIALGYQLIKSDMIDMAIVGGADDCHSFPYLKSWESLGVVDPDICRPFDESRAGLSIGDGAAILVLERENITGQDVEPLARLCGYGMSADADKTTAPDKNGMVSAMEQALKMSQLQASDIDYINAHGTGTQLNDQYESESINQIFGRLEEQPTISSTKPIHGHTMGAAGAFEAAIAIEALRRQQAPGTFRVKNIAKDCSINLATKTQDLAKADYSLSSSFAFGGINCSLVFGKT